MLVLTRKHQEKIRIGDNITITILKTKGKAVRVGIEAPTEIAVVRGELAAANAESPAAASGSVEEPAAPAAARSGRRSATHAAPSWALESHPRAADRRRRQSTVEVTLERVPRKDAAQILPRLVGEGGPLRSMVERRATV